MEQNNKPVIAHIISEFMQAGQSYTYRQFINHIKYQVVVLSRFYFRGSRRFFPVEELHAMAHIGRVYVLFEKRFPKLTAWLFDCFVIFWVKRRNIKLLHIHFGTLGAKLARLKDRLQITILVSFYGADTTVYPRKPEWQEMYKEMFAKVDGFIALSETPKKQLIAIGAPAEKCFVVSGSVDTDKLAFVERMPSEEVKFLIVARLVEKKGYFILLDAFNELVKSGRKVKLVIVGFGFLKEKILQKIEELGLISFVEFNDSSQPKDYFSFIVEKYQQADVFVLPSIVASDKDQEGTPLTILEASSTGLPIIGTNVAGVPEVVNDGETGYIVEQRNVEALVEKMAYLADHPEVRQQFGKAGRLLMEAKFSLKSLPDRLDAVYSKFIRL